jgi:hypothetical protein
VLCGLAIRGSCCNQFTLRVANTECFRLIIYYPFNCNQIVVQVTIDFTLRVANNEYVRLILYYPLQLQPNSGSSCNQFTLPSCKYRVLSLDNILPLQLQPDSGSSCNRCTLRVANTECFLLIIYYPFSCNPIVVRVAIDVHSELQIRSDSAWYYTTLQLQLDSGSSCNRCTLRVANTECFHLILYYPFNCNRTVLRVAIDVHFELQKLSFQGFHLASGLHYIFFLFDDTVTSLLPKL